MRSVCQAGRSNPIIFRGNRRSPDIPTPEGGGLTATLDKAPLDTDILSEIIKGFDPTVARDAAAYDQAFGRFTLSAISVMEIVHGFRKNQSARKLQSFLAQIAAEEVIDFNQADGVRADRIAGE